MPTPPGTKQTRDDKPVPRANLIPLSEDWLAVIIAFVLIVLSAIGLLGPHGIKVVF